MQGRAIGTIGPERLQGIELLRILAAFGIVAYHAGAPFRDFAYSGLIVFLLFSPMLDTRFNWERVRPVGTLARKLLLPWAFWMVVYGAANWLQHKTIFPGGWTDILYGTSPHLWFLPFMFLVLAVLNMVKPRFPCALFWLCAAAACALLFTVSVWRPISLMWAHPFPQWIHAAPPVFAGIALGLMGKAGSGKFIALLVFAGALIVADAALLPGVGTPYTIGIVLAAVTVFWSMNIVPDDWNIHPISACMMGVYLCHILVLKIVGATFGTNSYLTVSVTFIVALGAVWAARRLFPLSRFVLG